MLRKFTVLSLSATLLLTLALFCSSRQSAAVNNEMLDMAAMLPDSDIVVSMDFDRTFNIAATNLLSQDAKKIEHLKNLMKTVENQIGIDPYQIRQIAAGFKMPPANSKDFANNAEFTAIVRTTDSNAEMLDNWSRRIEAIMAFREEQNASRKFMDDFKVYREFKFDKAAPEKITEATRLFQDALKKSQNVAAKLSALPKLTADATAVSNLKEKNQTIIDDLTGLLTILKADAEMKAEREISIKLQNRWNAITIDDAQRTARLAAIIQESKEISKAFESKYNNARKIELLFAASETDSGEITTVEKNLAVKTNTEVDIMFEDLGKLPPTKAAKTVKINQLSENAEYLHNELLSIAEAPNSISELVEPLPIEETDTNKPKPPTLYDTLKKIQRAETINGKKLIVIDMVKMNAPDDKMAGKSEAMPNLAIGFLDDKTMVIGFEKTVVPFLKRDANYRNQNVLEMLGSAQNSLFAFAINSKATSEMFSQFAKTDANAQMPKVPASSFYDSLTKNISIYGSVNFDGDKATNDITMSLGFFKEIVGNMPLPEASADKNFQADSTFEFAGYQVGKDIFYDLFNSFKAVQASMTFKFEKKKIAALVRSTPKIIASIRKENSAAKKNFINNSQNKPDKLESVADLLTAPQFYIDLAKLLNKKV